MIYLKDEDINMNLNEAFSLVIDFMIFECTNKEIIERLKTILNGIKDKKNVEEFNHPRHVSLVIFGQNLFPFSDMEYIQIGELLANKRTIL